MVATNRVLRDNRNGLVRRIVDNYEALERAPGSHLIEHKIHRPNLVRAARPHQRLPFGSRDLLAPPTPDMQLFERVPPLSALVVDDLASLPELQVDHPNPISPMALRQSHYASP